MKYTDVSYQTVPKDEECFVNAVQIAKLINEPPSTIRTWAKDFENYLYIKKVNGHFKYTERSIEQFKDIKHWKRDLKHSNEQIKITLSKKGKHLAEYSEGLVNPEDPFAYDVLAGKIMQKNEDMLKEFSMAFNEHMVKREENLILELKKETSITIQEILENYLPKESQIVSVISKEINQSLISMEETKNVLCDELKDTKEEIIKLREENEKARLENLSLRSENEELTTKEINRLKRKLNIQEEELKKKENELKSKEIELEKAKEKKGIWGFFKR